MKEKNLAEMSNEDLLKTEKSIKVMTSILAVALALLFVINLITAFKKGFSALTVIPIALLPIVIVNINNIKKIRAELMSRGL
ncbi:redox-active disulfide protein 2 [Pedobacter aquatilis]|uniref:redox-active disulfide protein 2 n=1 Tax=Pedobacter aquatilis TaxID=351343 RepID=UPI00292FC6BF|nr:redox-active disulfide protein 2 [Pedobacter aquatilis]